MSSIYIDGPIATVHVSDLEAALDVLRAQYLSLIRLKAGEEAEKLERVILAFEAIRNDSDCIMLDGRYEELKGVVGFGSRVRVKDTVQGAYAFGGLFFTVTSHKKADGRWRLSVSQDNQEMNEIWVHESRLELQP